LASSQSIARSTAASVADAPTVPAARASIREMAVIAVSQTGDRQGSSRVVPSGSRSTSRASCPHASRTSGASSSQPIARSAMMLQTMGGKIAPSPSLPSNRESIQRRQA